MLRKKPASSSWRAFKARLKLLGLEGEFASDDQAASTGSGQAGIAETVSAGAVACIQQDWINTAKVEVIEGVNGRRVNLKRCTFGHPEALVDGHVGKVGDRITHGVAGNVAKGRAKHLLCDSGIDNEPNIVVGNGNRRSGNAVVRVGGDVDLVHADQLIRPQGAAGNSEQSCCIAAEDAHAGNRSIRVTGKRTGRFLTEERIGEG